MNSDMTLGEQIRIRRELLGMSRMELGELCGYTPGNSSRNMVQRWEESRRPVPLEKVRCVSRILSIPIERFIPPEQAATKKMKKWDPNEKITRGRKIKI